MKLERILNNKRKLKFIFDGNGIVCMNVIYIYLLIIMVCKLDNIIYYLN